MSVLDRFRSEKKQKEKLSKDEQIKKDLEVVSLIKSKYNASYKSKAKQHTQWDKNLKAYSGELFDKKLPDYKSNELSNYIFATIETVKPIILSNYPMSVVLPRRSEDFGKAKLVQNALDFEWRREKMFEKLIKMCHYALVYGTAVIYLPWDGNDSNGIGNVKANIISPKNIFPDPKATSEDNAEYIIYADYLPVGEIIKAFPEKAEELKEQVVTMKDDNLQDKDSSSQGEQSVLYMECYIRDYSVETIIEDELDDNGERTGTQYKKTRAKYPNGRRIIIGGDVLLHDGENPYKDGKAPFRIWRCYSIPSSFWGISEVENLISPQLHMSDLMNSVIENAGLMSNPVWILDKNSGVEKNSLTNRRGLVIRKNPGTDVRREQPPSIPAYVINTIDVLKNDIERVSGVYDVTRGERPAGVTAAAAITALNEQSQGRIKLKVQMLEEVISDIGAMWVSRIQQFWETTRTIRVMGGSYEAESEQDENTIGVAGRSYKFYDVSKDDLDGDFDIEIVSGSTMSKNKGAMTQLLIQMAQTMAEDGLPLVDRQTVLENSEIAGVEEIIERFNIIRDNKAKQDEQAIQQQTQQSLEQQQFAMEQKMQEKQMDMEHEATMKQMDTEKEKELTEHNTMLDMLKETGKESDSSNKTLQSGQDGSNYNQEELDKITQIIEALSQMSEEEIMQLAQENPEIMQFIEMLNNLSQQTQQ